MGPFGGGGWGDGRSRRLGCEGRRRAGRAGVGSGRVALGLGGLAQSAASPASCLPPSSNRWVQIMVVLIPSDDDALRLVYLDIRAFFSMHAFLCSHIGILMRNILPTYFVSVP